MSRLLKRAMMGLAALTVGLGAASVAAAQSTCGVSGATVASLGNYDPFNPAPLSNISATIRLTRYANGPAKTQQVNFYFVKPAGSPGYQILYQGTNVVYTAPTYSGAPVLSLQNNQVSGLINHNFGGGGQPDTVDLPVIITVPPGADLSAGDPIKFDIRYICNGTGPQMGNVTSPTILPNAITLTINVLSALQASYAGPALDFGEIGDKSDNDVTTTPIIRTGAVRVASSGPYTVAMTSANNYQLKAGGPETVNYQATFLGQTVSNSSPSFTTRTCARATVAGTNLPISAQLLQGGQGRAPAPVYSDQLTVTVTPLLTSAAPAALPCS